MSNAVMTHETMNTPTLHASPLNPRSFQELMRFAEIAAGSGMVPREYAGKAAAIVIACQMGAELGLAPMQSLQNIAVINGRPSVWGDTLLALVRSSPVCDDVVEHIEGDGDALTAVCVATRKGKKPVEARFSYADARTAGLLNKTGPWKTYPRRMLQMRARGFALRDAFPDVLRGLITAEEAQDIPVDDATPTQPISHKERTPSLSEAGKKRVEDGANALIERVMGVSTRGELEAITSEDAVKKQRVFLRQRMPELADRVDQVVSETLDGIERHAQNERQDEPPAATMEEMPA